ncbi:MAG: PDZ domain-containing protein [Planctomycetia bacterium]|nr:PDZ domain-containing protein [Planctomycetia bacterium]
MLLRFRQRRFALAALAIAVAWLGANVRAEDKPAPGADEATLRQLIGDLADDRYAVRESAEQQLESAGLPAVPLLVEGAQSGDLEVVVRCSRVLASWAVGSDEKLADAARQELGRLAAQPVTVAGRRAAEVLASVAAKDEERALAEVLRLGAGYGTGFNTNIGDPRSDHLVISRAWRGGTEGLKHLRLIASVDYISIRANAFGDDALAHLQALKHLRKLELYGTAISEEGLKRLRDALPSTDIDIRRGGLLGVSGNFQDVPARISNVRDGSGAARAGLMPNDIVLRADGKECPDYKTLMGIIATKAPKDVMELEVDRDGQHLTIKATLDEWE